MNPLLLNCYRVYPLYMNISLTLNLNYCQAEGRSTKNASMSLELEHFTYLLQ